MILCAWDREEQAKEIAFYPEEERKSRRNKMGVPTEAAANPVVLR